jgi:hypothetical protein
MVIKCPPTGLLFSSFRVTVTVDALALSAVLTQIGEAFTVELVAKDPSSPVALKVTGDPDSPVEVAVTLFSPAVAPKVRTVEAFPSAPVVVEVTDRDPLPDAMANVTPTPLTGFPLMSVTLTTKGSAKALPTIPI